MIIKLKIANFKSHKNTELNTGNLTVLTGINSSGKSSVLQSLLLLRQSFKKGRLSEGLDLNEPLKNIKTKNVGFGISYSLPVVVALLAAKKGALLIIENPEAHLHPRG
ncbi:MAG: AAA family ATPase [Prevotellaceae bacterium]|jgi:predicted ATPase|nr:AAA family ATPase [Prevotellaceae bacterium]